MDIQRASAHPDWCYTTDLFLRYAYLAWLVLYFMLSNLRFEYEPPSGWAAVFDLTQSLCAFVAAVCLGFVLPAGTIASITDSLYAFAAANAAIAVLAGLSLLVGGGRAIMRLRKWGFALSFVGALVSMLAAAFQPGRVLYLLTIFLLAGTLVALWGVLASFGTIRICQLKKA